MDKPGMILITAVFLALTGWTFFHPATRTQAMKRNRHQWLIDFIGLAMQGTVIPFLQVLIVFGALAFLFPHARAGLHLNSWLSFALSFVGVDYLYYWNHRWLHQPGVWRFHSLHHSGEGFDVFTTSRNSAFSSLLIIYLWVNGSMLYFLDHPLDYAWGIAINNTLELFRHSGLNVSPSFFPFNLLVSPREHAWHHSADKHGVNFGASINLWDKIHGTHYSSETLPEKIGAPLAEGNPWKTFWWGSQ